MAGIDRVEVDNMSVQFFEGVEKLLEIWFTTSDGNNKNPDLRKIPRFVFKCSRQSNELALPACYSFYYELIRQFIAANVTSTRSAEFYVQCHFVFFRRNYKYYMHVLINFRLLSKGFMILL